MKQQFNTLTQRAHMSEQPIIIAIHIRIKCKQHNNTIALQSYTATRLQIAKNWINK